MMILLKLRALCVYTTNLFTLFWIVHKPVVNIEIYTFFAVWQAWADTKAYDPTSSSPTNTTPTPINTMWGVASVLQYC